MVVDTVVSRLIELGYLDDVDYARRFASARLERQYGPRRIVQELRRKGVPSEIADEAVAGARDEGEIRERAVALARQRAARLHRESDPRKRKKRIYDHLIRRGFDSQLAWSIVNALDADESE
jgi:regulatory protein